MVGTYPLSHHDLAWFGVCYFSPILNFRIVFSKMRLLFALRSLRQKCTMSGQTNHCRSHKGPLREHTGDRSSTENNTKGERL